MDVIISVSAGTDDPTRATLGMLAAKAAADQGHSVTLWLQGEGAVVANRNVYANIQGVNMPPMKSVVEALVTAKVPIWVCEACAKGRNVVGANLLDTASLKGMGEFVAKALAADRALSF
jgi:predicted peroxiredoxin